MYVMFVEIENKLDHNFMLVKIKPKIYLRMFILIYGGLIEYLLHGELIIS